MTGTKSPSVLRLEFFSDGVFAIIMTIMAIELEVPDIDSPLTSDLDFQFLAPALPKLLSYGLGFFMVATGWLSQVLLTRNLQRTNVQLISANLFWLFLVSLIPAATTFIGDHPTEPKAVMIWSAVAGAVLIWGDIPLVRSARNAGQPLPGWVIRRNLWAPLLAILAVGAPLVWTPASWILVTLAYGLHWIPARNAAVLFGPKAEIERARARASSLSSVPAEGSKSPKTRSRKSARQQGPEAKSVTVE
jgi:uncharacterized membrane protein